MEDFIYIILAIVWLVISILGGRKKKKEQSAPKPSHSEPRPIESETPTAKGKSEFEDLLEDFFGSDSKTSEKQTTEKPAPSPQPAYSEERRYYDDSSRRSANYGEKPGEDIEKYMGADVVEDDFEFSAEGKVETLEDLIKSYDERSQKIEEEDAKMNVEDLDEEKAISTDFDFDARKAIVYAEIIKRKY